MDGVYSSASIVNDKLRLTKVDGVNYDYQKSTKMSLNS